MTTKSSKKKQPTSRAAAMMSGSLIKDGSQWIAERKIVQGVTVTTECMITADKTQALTFMVFGSREAIKEGIEIDQS